MFYGAGFFKIQSTFWKEDGLFVRSLQFLRKISSVIWSTGLITDIKWIGNLIMKSSFNLGIVILTKGDYTGTSWIIAITQVVGGEP